MYVPLHFSIENPEVTRAFIERHPFGTLVSSVAGNPFATHAPFVLADAGFTLLLHIAKANPQWREIDGQAVLAIFEGPHAMISASWYEDPAGSVPTWNYSAVHCSGRARVLDAPATHAILESMVERFEHGWRMQDADAAYIERMERAIVGIAIDVEHVDTKFKYSQNRSRADRDRAIAELERSERSGDRETAAAMRALLSSEDSR